MKAVVFALALVPFGAQAHDGVVHGSDDEAASHEASNPAEGLPLPFNLGGPFALIDQNGQPRTEADPAGNLQLLFFGYANCQEICSVAFPQMADVVVGLDKQGIEVTPVMITVDPERDTVESMGPALEQWHLDFVGLTGDDAALAVAYKAFAIESELVFTDPASGPVYAHGSFLYLLDGQGKFLTVLPPILTNGRMMEIIAGYAGGS
jgi:protein SCO1